MKIFDRTTFKDPKTTIKTSKLVIEYAKTAQSHEQKHLDNADVLLLY